MAKPFLAYIPYIQILNTDGTLNAGGSVTIYQPGTTTALNTYPSSTDAVNNTNVNPNPITLDSAGRPANSGNPIDIYVNQSYKLVVKNAVGTTIRTVDNITVIGQAASSSAKSANYVVTASDRDKLFIYDTTSAGRTLTLLAAVSAGDGFMIMIKKNDSSGNTLTIQANGSELIDGSNTLAITGTRTYKRLYCDGTQWLIIS